ncbi:MAG: ABC transporter permease subunit [bacterium]|nr:ABC transporter permease subunit [bacterium]
MYNLLRANFYRLRKSRTYKILLFGILIVILGFTNLYFQEEGFLMITSATDGVKKYGFYIGNVSKQSGYMELLRASLGFMFFICIGILFLIGDTVISPFQNGTIKNTLAYGLSKRKLYLSQLITNIVGGGILAISSIVLSMGVLCIIFTPGQMITVAEIRLLLKVILLVLISLTAMISVYHMLAAIVKNGAVVTTIGALFMTIGQALLFNLIDASAKQHIPIYMILEICGDPAAVSQVMPFLLNAGSIVAITTILGCIIYSKQEIK